MPSTILIVADEPCNLDLLEQELTDLDNLESAFRAARDGGAGRSGDSVKAGMSTATANWKKKL